MNRLSCVLSVMVAVILFGTDARAQQAASAPTAAPGVTSAASPDVQSFQKVEDAWAEAVNQRDQYALELVLSPLFVDVSATGEITTRNQQLVQVMDIEDKTLHLEQKVITVRLIGEIAVANGTYMLHHKAGSSSVDEKGVFTHVFERGRSGWLCINSQRTMLRTDATGKPKKPSNAEMPFHIPLFSKGEKNN